MTDEQPSGEGKPSEESPSTISPGGKGPLRGTGSGFGVNGPGGGAGSEFLRRAREAAEAARRMAEERRPAAERAAHDVAEQAKRAVEAARPEAERLARQARAAAEAARPHVEHAAQEAASFAREHEDDLKSVAARAARIVAPLPLRPALDAIEEELRRKSPPQENDTTPTAD